MKKVSTYLPVFSGFYNSIWQPDHLEERELEYINEERDAKGLPPVEFDKLEFDNAEYELNTVKSIASQLAKRLEKFVSGIEVEGVVSPKEYNFRNDSANIIVSLSVENEHAIKKFLIENEKQFSVYLKDCYTSCSGFYSSYPNSIPEFMEDQPLRHAHKLGSILNFIAQFEDGDETELNIYYNVESNISVKNYSELVPE